MPDLEGWFDGEEPTRVHLSIVPRDLKTVKEVWDLLDEMSAAGNGWICTTGRVWRVPLQEADRTTPLSAEIARADGSSVHLRRFGDGWRAWTYVEAKSTGGAYLAFRETFISTEMPAKMKYATYWRLEAEGSPEISVWRPRAARFLGWEG